MPCIIFLSIAFCLFTVTCAGQSVPVTPFRIEPGSSFSASPEKKPAARRTGLTEASEKVASDYIEALEIVQKNHVGGGNLDTQALAKSSINTMLGELDPHSSYFDRAEFDALLGEQNSEYSGTGSTISNFVKDNRIETYVVATQPGSAAARANLRYGDRIVSVDGVAVTGSMVDAVRDRVRGPRGTFVRLTVERASIGAVQVLDLMRERIPQPSVRDAFILRDGVGYIDLSEGFSHTTSAEFNLAMSDLEGRGMRALVLDLRHNSGGIVDTAVKVAEKFLPAGSPIISQRGRDPMENMTWRSENPRPSNIPLVVLVDSRTASAAEIVAGALQDNDRALLIGQQTFGKGLVQRVIELPLGSGLTLTTGRYLTPSGRSIQRSYSGSGLYDYYNQRQSVFADKTETRTRTNRPVFGGTGITPDEIATKDAFVPTRAKLIDPIFFFVREKARDHKACTEISDNDCRRKLLAKFREYAVAQGISPHTIDSEAEYVTNQLEYQFALATTGSQAAERSKVRHDAEIARAIASVPAAAALAASAKDANKFAEKKKPAGSHSRAGQGRNRRN
ncbi:MAG TPA: S41 family peptidase [Pyrinomonadaceae bacterium]|nr:S41 family peptidase [Pyrinomonadaceae bacterium]